MEKMTHLKDCYKGPENICYKHFKEFRVEQTWATIVIWEKKVNGKKKAAVCTDQVICTNFSDKPRWDWRITGSWMSPWTLHHALSWSFWMTLLQAFVNLPVHTSPWFLECWCSLILPDNKPWSWTSMMITNHFKVVGQSCKSVNNFYINLILASTKENILMHWH